MQEYTLSKVQAKLLRFQEMFPKDPSYNLTLLYKIAGNFDSLRFVNIINICLDHIDVMKVSFRKHATDITQEYDNTRKIECEFIQRSEPNESQFRSYAYQMAYTYQNQPINLFEWPLANVKLLWNQINTYYLIISMPHILADAYSCYGLFTVITELYNSQKNIEEIIQEVQRGKFGSFLATIDNVEDVSAEKAKAYFEKQFCSNREIKNMNISQSRNSNGYLEGRNISFFLDENISHQVVEFTKKNKVSEFVFFLAIYGCLLSKVTGEDTITSGIPIASRDDLNIVGYYVNTLPAILEMQDDKSFLKFCSELAANVYELLRYRKYDFTDSGITGIMENMNNAFSYQKQEISFMLNDCNFERIPIETKSALFEFTSVVEKRENNYKVEFNCGEYFKRINLEKIYCNIIHQVVEQPNIKIGKINLITDQEAVDFYNKVNHFIPYYKEDTVASRFYEIVKKYSDLIALDFNDELWTYRELDEISEKIARVIYTKYPDFNYIAVSLERGHFLIAVILGILKTGKSYVPIDLISPPKRVSYILGQLKDTAIVCEENMTNSIDFERDNVLSIKELQIMLNQMEDDVGSIEFITNPEDIAYMIFTSGSTGNPKGVSVSNRNLLSLFESTHKITKFDETDVWTMFHSYGFDFSVWEIFGCLLSGGKLIIVDYLHTRSPKDYYQLVVRKGVTVLNQTPTAFLGFVNEDILNGEKLNVKYVMLGGEVVHMNTLKKWTDRHNLEDVEIYIIYGITETSIITTYHKIRMQDIESAENSIIGSPYENSYVYVVDRNMNVLPAGIHGELLIYGDGVTKGYFNNEELTAKKYVIADIVGRKGIYYRSGDLTVVNEDMEIEYLGRIDKQVQLRGFRIELSEIENTIIDETNHKSCVVDLMKFGENDERIVAYVVAGETEFDALQIKDKLRMKLPNYMIPSYIYEVESIPMTVNGKVNSEELQKVIPEKNEFEENESETEKKLKKIIADTVKCDNFSKKENFFDIGVTSIHLSDIYYEIVKKFSLDNFEMVELFKYTNVEALAEYIDINKNNSTSIKTERKVNRGTLRRQKFMSTVQEVHYNE